MRNSLLALVAASALAQSALAQSGSGGRAAGQVRVRCRDCDTVSASAVRAARLDSQTTAFVREIERVAREVIERRQVQSDLARRLQDLVRVRAEQNGENPQVRATTRTLQQQLAQESRMVSQLRSQLSALCSRTARPTGWLGVAFSGAMVAERDRDGVEFFKFDEHPRIESVEPGSPAEEAGIETGDVLIAIAGDDVRDQKIAFSSLLRPGARLTLRVQRGGRMVQPIVMVRRRPEQFGGVCPWVDQRIASALVDAPGQFRFEFVVPSPRRPSEPREQPEVAVARSGVIRPPTPVPPMPSFDGTVGVGIEGGGNPVAGAQLVELDDDGLREAVGVDRGLLVLRVLPGSPAERLGLRGGDVVVSVNSRAMASVRSFSRVLREAREADDRELTVRVVRKRKPVDLVARW